MVERIAWEEFTRRFRWNQGEHVTAIAPTGAGKTTLFLELARLRKYNLFLGTKIDDPMYRKLIRRGFRRVDSIDDVRPWDENVLLWPKQQGTIPETMLHQRERFREAFNTIVKQGAWTLWVDESKYMAEHLGLKRELTYALEQLRSIKATIISGAQRPVFLPLSTLSNSSHVFLWKTPLDTDAKRLADIGGVDAKEVAAAAQSLGAHEFLYIHTRGTESDMVRSQVGK